SPCWNGDMVHGSTLMYGSSFIMVILRPRASRMAASDAAAMPLPNEDTTPPVTKMRRVMAKPGAGQPHFTGCRRIPHLFATALTLNAPDPHPACLDAPPSSRMSSRYNAADIEVLSGLDPV